MILINIKEIKINEEVVNKVSKDTGIAKDIVRFMLKRGIPTDWMPLLISKEIQPLLPHNNITNVDKAASIINDYLRNDAHIYIFGDYDSDGVNSNYIMYMALIELVEALEINTEIEYYLPDRTEGYGLNMDWCKRLPKRPDTLVITVDNGITKLEEVNYLMDHNIDVIITDHHVPQEGLVPNTLIVDPHLHDIDNENACGLCGAAVAFKIMAQLYKEYYDSEACMDKYIINVAIATITDVMPVTKENIIFVNNGMKYLNDFPYDDYEYCPMTSSMYYFAGINKNGNMKPKDIAFGLGPQINSCGRMGTIDTAMNFMLSTEEDDLTHYYREMMDLNDQRKLSTLAAIEEVGTPELTDLSLVVMLKGYEGIAGSLASKLCEMYNMPVIVFNESNGICSGSARSPLAYDLQELFRNTKYIESFGGHSAAAGVTIKKSNFEKFKKAFNKTISITPVKTNIDDTIYVDEILTTADLNKYKITQYDNILFFNNFKRPVYYLDKLQIVGYHTSKNNPNNICFHIKHKNREIKVWCWGFTETYKSMGCPPYINIVGSLEIFNNMFVVDIYNIEAA